MSIPVWEWKSDKGVFTAFTKAISATIEKAFQAKSDPISVKIRDTAYDINVKAFTQSNASTGTIRYIRRLNGDGTITVCGATWQCYVGSSWEPYAPQLSAEIERAHARGDLKVGVTLIGPPKIQGIAVTVHFGHMQQINDDTKTTHKVRRISSAAVMSDGATTTTTVVAPVEATEKSTEKTAPPPVEVSKKRVREDDEEAPPKLPPVVATLKPKSSTPPSWKKEGSLLVRRCSGCCGSSKIAGFDMDDTLITTKSGKVFASSSDDWRFVFPEVPAKLAELVKQGYNVYIFSNQAGIGKGDKWDESKARQVVDKIDSFLSSVGLQNDVGALLACRDDEYRKPATQMWQYMVKQLNNNVPVSNADSFYVGDAAGRTGLNSIGRVDFSCSDRMFAYNLQIPFMTPEEFFLGQPPKKFVWSPFDPHMIEHPGVQKVPPPAKGVELIIMVGFPGSGKSTIAKKYFVQEAGYVHVNRDTLKTAEKCVKAADEALASGRSVIVDNTSPSPDDRAKYVSVAKKHRVPCRCFLMMTTEAQAKHLNLFRENFTPGAKVPGIGYNMFKSKFQEPSMEEGFSAIEEIEFIPNFDGMPPGAKKMFLETPAVV